MLGGELRNGLPESAQGFLSFGEVEYYDALSRAIMFSLISLATY